MGYNATLVVMVDALDAIKNDPEFGKKLADAIQHVAAYQHSDHFRYGQGDVAAHSKNGGIHTNAATVIEVHHADHDIFVRVGGNMGKPMKQNFGKPKAGDIILEGKE
jgi:hypothetical protein